MSINSHASFDHASLEKEWGDESALEMAKCYAEDTRTVLQDLDAGSQMRDAGKVRTQAHMLKGCSRAICGRRVEKASADVEMAAIKQDWDAVLSGIEVLKPLYLQLISEVDAYVQSKQT
jgi:hypothetical protein